jgi:hypothetical protein
VQTVDIFTISGVMVSAIYHKPVSDGTIILSRNKGYRCESSVSLLLGCHLPATVTSFLTDDLQTVIECLKASEISFDGPKKSHLVMTTLLILKTPAVFK